MEHFWYSFNFGSLADAGTLPDFFNALTTHSELCSYFGGYSLAELGANEGATPLLKLEARERAMFLELEAHEDFDDEALQNYKFAEHYVEQLTLFVRNVVFKEPSGTEGNPYASLLTVYTNVYTNFAKNPPTTLKGAWWQIASVLVTVTILSVESVRQIQNPGAVLEYRALHGKVNGVLPSDLF